MGYYYHYFYRSSNLLPSLFPRLAALIETLRQQNGDGGGNLLERAPGGPTSMMHSGISQAREFDDPPGLHEKTEYLLREWVTMYHSPAAGRDSTKAFSAFVGQVRGLE
jgi:CCR4-NOT transcription complex subunit 1